MAERNLYMRKLLGHPARFADFYNGTVFGGRQVLRPEELSDVPGEQGIVILDENGSKRVVERRRDIIKKASFGAYFILTAVENQDGVHYGMPVRSMMYDALDYTEQIERLRQTHKKNGDSLNGSGFLSGITREDRLTPVVSLIFYHGLSSWDGPKCLYDMLGIDASKEEADALKQVLPDYRMNLIEASGIEHPERFSTSLQYIFSMLKYKADKNELYRYARQHRNDFRDMDNDSMLAMFTLLGEQKRLLKIWETSVSEGKEQADMCIAIDELIEDGKAIGKMEGKAEGRAEGKIEGKMEGENQLAALIDRLLQDGRMEDIRLAAGSRSARNDLYEKYGIIK